MHIAYFANTRNSFVNQDLHILDSFTTVKVHIARINSKYLLPFKLLSQLFFIVRNVFWSDLYLCQFSGYTSLLPSIFAKVTGKKCIIVVGGTDTAKFPKIKYGNFAKGLYGLTTKWSYHLATAVIAPHQHLIKSDYDYCDLGKPRQGIKVHYPVFNKPVFIIPNVVDTDYWSISTPLHREGILTVASGFESERIQKLKGIDMLIELARRMPDQNITIVGYKIFPKNLEIPTNIRLLPIAEKEELKSLFQNHQFYAQLSIFEGWGVALCEAMSCGCVPIVSKVGAMPHIVSGIGYILNNRNINDLIELIQGINIEDLSLRSEKASTEIKLKYDYSIRKKLLIETIHHIAKM